MRYSLDGIWDLTCIKPGNAEGRFTLQATVPGNVELDLFKAGIEPDPYYGTNEYLYQKYEVCDWEYTRSFIIPKEISSSNSVNLVFEGLNCIADVFVDDALTAHFENSLITHRVDLSDIEGGEHILKIHIYSALLYAREKDFPVSIRAGENSDEFARLRMPAHSFGWDIMPRFPSAGLWRSVYIETVPHARFEQVYYAFPSVNEKSASVVCRVRIKTSDYDLSGYRIRISLDDQIIKEIPIHFISSDASFSIPNPRLWWPAGYGDAALYEVKAELVINGEVTDVRTEKIGIRKAEIIHKMAAGEEGEFLIKINGCPILAKGANWVPMDAFHSRDAQRCEAAISLFKEAGCNILRLWGGNVYEDTKLFNLCDENGIMVWHDFSMACAIYPQDREFQNMIREEAEQIVRKHRNHPSIILWSGDNEVDEAYCWRNYYTENNHYNALTREVLPEVIRQNDPYRMFLPSSPYIANGIKPGEVPEQHNWGARAYFKDDYYKYTKAHFVSECGYHGCPSVSSLAKFIPSDELSARKGDAWTAHNSEYALFFKRGYDRNQLMADQVKLMFGEIPEDLELFSVLSQFTQAEAIKFFIERTRIKKWRRTGIIWWNMIDGWPQISDAVVDWYYDKKRAFETIRRVQVPVCVMIDEPRDWYNDIVIGNDSRECKQVCVDITDADTNRLLFSGEFLSPANQNIIIGSLRGLSTVQSCLIIIWVIDGIKYRSHYLCGFPAYRIADVQRWIKVIDEG